MVSISQFPDCGQCEKIFNALPHDAYHIFKGIYSPSYSLGALLQSTTFFFFYL